MEGNKNISEELRLISGFVATISRVTPYGLPDGYFAGLAGKVLDRVRAGETLPKLGLDAAGETDWSGNDREPGLSPDDIRIPEFLGAGSSAPVYSVPEGYFEGFAGKLMSRIKAGQGVGEPDQSPREELALLSPLLSRIDKKMPFEVPQGYFDELSGTVAANIGLLSGHAEAENLSPLLAGLKDKQVYQAPKGYFESFSDTVLTKVKKPVPAARVISIGGRKNWWKYAAAAVMTGLILSGGWLKLHHSGSGAGTIDLNTSLSNVSDQEIESYLDNHNVPVAESVPNSTPPLHITHSDIKNMFGDIPHTEFNQYINDHWAIKDPATN